MQVPFVSIEQMREVYRLGASKLLHEKAAGHPQMDVRLNTTVQQFKGKGKLSAAVVKDVNTGETQEVNPGAVFIFIGLDPNTEFLRDVIDLDQ